MNIAQEYEEKKPEMAVISKQQAADHIASLIVNILIECQAKIKDKAKLRYELAYKLRKHHDLKGLYNQFGIVIKLALENKRWQDVFLTIIRRTNMLGAVLTRHGFDCNPVEQTDLPEIKPSPLIYPYKTSWGNAEDYIGGNISNITKRNMGVPHV